MLHYPYALYCRGIQHSPLFRNLQNVPLPIDLSDGNRALVKIDVRDPRELQCLLDKKMTPGHSWGLGGYLERREMLLRYFPEMVQEKRFYHLGLDILVPLNTLLHSPLDAVVRVSDYEDGNGNYGGYMLLEHIHPEFETFYSLYGHLNPDSHSAQVRRPLRPHWRLSPERELVLSHPFTDYFQKGIRSRVSAKRILFEGGHGVGH